MKNKILFFGIAATLLGGLFFTTDKAYADDGVQVIYSDSHITGVSLDKSSYNSGDTVSGTTDLINNGGADVPDIYLDVSLAGGYSNSPSSYHIPKTIYDTKSFGPIYIRAGESLSVPFSYFLPSNVGGNNLGIRVKARLASGLFLGFKDSFINVSGGNPFLKVQNAYIGIGKNVYTINAGPTIYASTTAVLHVGVYNGASSAMTVSPKVEIYNRIVQGDALKSANLSKVKIPAKGNYEILIPLDLMDNIPGVYVARLSLLDDTGNLAAEEVDYRYIVAGLVATIQSVSLNKQSLVISYSGSTHDIGTTSAEIFGQADLKAKIFNDKTNELIGESNGQVSLDADYATTSLNIGTKGEAQSKRVEITIEKDGKILASYHNVFISPDNSAQFSPSTMLFAALILIILIVIGIITVKSRNKKVGLSMFFAFALITGAIIFTGDVAVEAATLCGAANGTTVSAVPSTANLCHSGTTFSNLLLNSSSPKQFTWSCGASSCSANVKAVSIVKVSSTAWKSSEYGLTPGVPTVVVSDPSSSVFNRGDTIDFQSEVSTLTCRNSNDYNVIEVYIADTSNNKIPGSSFDLIDNSHLENPVANAHLLGAITDKSDTSFTFDSSLLTAGNYRLYINAINYQFQGTNDPTQCNLDNPKVNTATCHMVSRNSYLGYIPINLYGSSPCANGATNSPTCTICQTGQTLLNNVCVNNCSNGATNPTDCNSCTPGVQTYIPTTDSCVNNCTNGANNPTDCNTCPTGLVYFNGVCQTGTVTPTPTNFTATTGSTCGGSTQLTWSPSAGATGYYIYRLNQNTGNYYVINPGGTASNVTAYTDNPGQGTFSYKISASSTAGESELSPAQSVQSSLLCQSNSNPAVTLTANPTHVQNGGKCTLIWSVQGATSCILNGVGINNQSISLTSGTGSMQGGALSSSATYSLKCSNATQANTKTATCSVTPSIIEN